MMLDADSVVFQNIDELFKDDTDAIWTMDRYTIYATQIVQRYC